MDNFRKNLSLLCNEHGAIQAIADRAKMTRAHVSNILHGKAIPSLECAAKIADAVGFELANLLAPHSEFKKNLAKVS